MFKLYNAFFYTWGPQIVFVLPGNQKKSVDFLYIHFIKIFQISL